jgi:hypothetical protein
VSWFSVVINRTLCCGNRPITDHTFDVSLAKFKVADGILIENN